MVGIIKSKWISSIPDSINPQTNRIARNRPIVALCRIVWTVARLEGVKEQKDKNRFKERQRTDTQTQRTYPSICSICGSARYVKVT